MSNIAYHYGSWDVTPCQEVGDGNCTKNQADKTPAEVIRACECHEPCERFAFKEITQYVRYERGTF